MKANPGAAILLMGFVIMDAPRATAGSEGFAKSSNAFALDLHRRLGGDGNLVFSPASVSMALAMTWGGAKGPTADEMRKALRLEGPTDAVMQEAGKIQAALTDSSRPVVFRIANRLFGERTFTFVPAYLAATKAAFGAPLEGLDFKLSPEPSRATINRWVEAQTEKRIVDLVPAGGELGYAAATGPERANGGALPLAHDPSHSSDYRRTGVQFPWRWHTRCR
jgi:serpin B